MTLGVGTAAVQGVRVARGLAETSSNFLTVMRFSRQSLTAGAPYGKVTLTSAPGQRPNMSPDFQADPSNEEAKKTAAKARLAYENLPRSMKSLSVEMIEYDQAADVKRAGEPGEVGAAPDSSTPGPARRAATRSDDFYALIDSGLSWLQDNTAAVGAALLWRHLPVAAL